MNNFKKGDKVTFIPNHAFDDPNHEDCQDGVVSSVNDHYVFVKYNCALGEAITGDEPWTAQSTKRENLVKRI